MKLFIICLMALVVTSLLTWRLLIYARQHEMLDHPGRRRSHALPTPRGGGIAVVFSFILALLCLFAFDLISAQITLAILAGLLPVTLSGWLDDRYRLGIVPRLLIQAFAVVAFLTLLWPVVPVNFPFGLELSGWLAAIFWFLLMVWFINVFNFMDGIDLLAIVESLSMTLGMAILFFLSGSQQGFALAVVLFASSLGFYSWNRPPAKIFMGDSGSCSLGFLLMVLVYFLSEGSTEQLWSGLILASVFFFDALFTLVKRLFSTKRWYNPHREHLYQWLVRFGFAHGTVSWSVLALNLLVLLPLALLARNSGQGFLIFSILLVVSWFFWWYSRWRLWQGARKFFGEGER